MAHPPPDVRVVLGWRPGELFPFPFFLFPLSLVGGCVWGGTGPQLLYLNKDFHTISSIFLLNLNYETINNKDT